MKKLIIALVAAVGLVATVADAQTYDLFNGTRVLVMTSPQNIGVGQSTVTNGPVDHVRLTGRVLVSLNTITNTGTTGGTLTATLYSSPDQTNLTAITGIALATSTTLSYTNGLYGGTNLVANNTVMEPGVATSPTVYSSGFAAPYLAPAAFTNTGAITLNGKPNVLASFNIDDQYRYIYVIYTSGGSATNFTTSGLIIGTTK